MVKGIFTLIFHIHMKLKISFSEHTRKTKAEKINKMLKHKKIIKYVRKYKRNNNHKIYKIS